MRFRRLESRIVVFFLLLILAVQLVGFTAIRAGINQHARSEVRKQLVIGEPVFRRLLEKNAPNLATGARIRALDYGFRQAIGTNDNETIVSVLDNHGARIGAALTVLIGTDRQIRSSMSGNAGETLQQSALPLIDAAEKTGSGAGIRLVDGHPYQVVVVPVKVPQSIAVMQLLAEMGCDQGQGYFISGPMPAAKLVAWIDTWVLPAQHPGLIPAIAEEV